MTNHSFINGTGNESTHVFSIHINITKLQKISDPAYKIDPYREQMTINITNLANLAPGVKIDLTAVKICTFDSATSVCAPLLTPLDYPYVDGSNTRLSSMPATLQENIALRLRPYYFDYLISKNIKDVFILLQFDLYDSSGPINSTFLNNTQTLPNFANLQGDNTFFSPATKIQNPNTIPFDYNYYPDNVTQPKLRDAVMEVAVW